MTPPGARAGLTPPEACDGMAEVRAGIDAIDRELVALIAERTRYIEAAGRIKDEISDVRLEWRIEEVVAKVLAAANAHDAPASIVEPVWRELIDRSIAHEFAVWRRVHGGENNS